MVFEGLLEMPVQLAGSCITFELLVPQLRVSFEHPLP